MSNEQNNQTAITLKGGGGVLHLTKSDKLVGVKLLKPEAKENEDLNIKEEIHNHLGGFQMVELHAQAGYDINEQLDELRQHDDVELGTHVYHTAGSNKPIIATGEIYVIFHTGVTLEKQRAIFDEYHLQEKSRRHDDRAVVKVTTDSPNPFKCAAALQQKPEVKKAEPDIDIPLDTFAYAAPTAALMPHMWHLKNQGIVPDDTQMNQFLKAGSDAKVVDAWRRLDGFGNPNVIVAVADNGFDLTHPDLKGKIVKPFDFWHNSTELESGNAAYTHGTPCASVAIGPPNGGVVGSAPVARFMPLSGTLFSDEYLETMLDYCIRNGASVLSCSWGTTDQNFRLSQRKNAALSRAARSGRGGKGMVICYAVGNEGEEDSINVYAEHPEVIAVAASTSKDTHADYSNTGRNVTVCAPSNGEWPITAARAFWAAGGTSDFWYGDDISRGDRYQHFGGTSSATPLVAGICALMLSANPNLTAAEVKQVLCRTADKIGSPSEYTNGHSPRYGYGRVNALRAVEEAIRRKGGTVTPTPQPTQPAKPVTPTPTQPTASRGLLRWGTNQPVPNKGWAVQAGSFTQLENVKQAAAVLQKFGQPILYHVAGSGSSTMYRVLVGFFPTSTQAGALQQSMKNGGVAGFIKDLATLG